MLDNHIEVEVHSPQSNRPAVDIPFCSFLMRRMPDLESEAAETNETTMYCKVSVRFYVVSCLCVPVLPPWWRLDFMELDRAKLAGPCAMQLLLMSKLFARFASDSSTYVMFSL